MTTAINFKGINPGVYFEKIILPRFNLGKLFTLHVYYRGTTIRAFRIYPDLTHGWKVIHFMADETNIETTEINNDGIKRLELLYNKIIEKFDITLNEKI